MYSPDGTKLLCCDNFSGAVINVQNGTQICAFGFASQEEPCISFSMDGLSILLGDGKVARIIDATSGKDIRSLTGHRSLVTAVAFSKDGSMVLTGSKDSTARIFNAQTGQEIMVFSGHADAVTGVGFTSGSSRIVTVSLDNTIRFWDVTTGKQIRSISETDDLLSIFIFPDDSRFLTNGENIRIRNIGTDSIMQTIPVHSGRVAVAYDGSRMAIVRNIVYPQDIFIYNTENGALVKTVSGHSERLCAVGITADGTRIVSAAHNCATLWDVGTGTILQTFGVEGGSVTASCADISPDGTMVLRNGFDKKINIISVASGQVVQSLSGSVNSVKFAQFSADGSKVIRISVSNIYVFCVDKY
jgi:WD40 repeat protein